MNPAADEEAVGLLTGLTVYEDTNVSIVADTDCSFVVREEDINTLVEIAVAVEESESDFTEADTGREEVGELISVATD